MEKRFETREIPALYLRAKVANIDVENRTIDVVFATDSPVRMWSWEKGEYIEELEMSKKAIRMERINAAGAVWDNHQYWEGTRGVIGKVVSGSVAISDGEMRGKIKFSKKERAEEIWQDIQDEIVSTVSVGYQVYRAEMVGEQDGVKKYRATDWEPHEVSIAPMPADINAQMRNYQPHKIEVEVEDFQRDLDHIELIKTRYKNL